MAKLFRYVKHWFDNKLATPDGIVRVTWVIFAATGPFFLLSLWRQPLSAWIVFATAGMWGFSFSNAYLHRLYYRQRQEQIMEFARMMEGVQFAFHMMHSHCPHCGAQLKEKEIQQ